MKYELLVGSRYVRSVRAGQQRGNGRFVSFISAISMLGIAIGVAVLIVVLSVMNGFEFELRNRIMSQTAHATISSFDSDLRDWRELAKKVARHPEVQGVAPYVEGQGMLVAQGVTSGAMIYGVLPEEERSISKLADHMRTGKLDALRASSYGVVLGDELAKALNVEVGDRVVLVIPQATVTMAGVTPRWRRFTVVGTFSAGMYEYDRNFAYIHLQDAERLYRMNDAVSGVRVKFSDLLQSPRIAHELTQQLGPGYFAQDWTRNHENFFRSIALTKRVMFVILLLVVGVAAFNIVSTLVMVVKEKQSDIAILRTLGVTPRSVLAIFVTQGTVIGLIGTLAGILLAVLIANNLQVLVHGLEAVMHTQFLDAKVYFMSDLPAVVEWGDVVTIGSIAFGLCCLSTLYPAYRAARSQPAQALRHE